jgi:hypothetical protein|nr:nuclear transport factor 2 family protein [uncultured Steroidobacter sp.]
MSDLTRKITDYYPRIDRLDTDWVIALFSEDAIYFRADATYSGRTAIARFFREQRKIRGRHTVDRMWTDHSSASVVAVGRFDGEGESGDSRCVRFADVWQFNEAGLVTQRQTFLALGHEYVER